MKKLMFMLSGILVLSLTLPAQVSAQSCCISKPSCQVVTCASTGTAITTTVSAENSVEAKETRLESSTQVTQLAFASFLSPVLNAASVLFASQMAALLTRVSSCDPSDCDPSCCFPPVCDPSSCDLSTCSAKKE